MLTSLRGRFASPRHGLARILRRIRRDERGVSAVEFGLIAPTLLVIAGGAIEFSGAITAGNRATYVADALAEMVSRSDHSLTDGELKNFAVASSLINPDILNYARQSGVEIEKAFKVTITSVQFDQTVANCTSNCAYMAKTVFSYTLNGVKRPCGVLTASSAKTTAPGSLPSEVYGVGSLIVVDIETRYMPTMPIKLEATTTFKRTSFFRPRYVSRINSEKSNCSGF